jgi:AcrR family transcriptional regulator
MDIDDRRRVVSEAAWRVLIRDGLTELSVRKVAAEAGLPPSSLRYTFPTQGSVRDAAVSLLIERLMTRVAHARMAAPGRTGARAILLELLPLDDERRSEMEVSVSFIALSMTDASLRPAYEKAQAAVRGICAQALELIGAAQGGVDLTHAVVDGLALHILGQQAGTSAEWAVKALDAHLVHLQSTPS